MRRLPHLLFLMLLTAPVAVVAQEAAFVGSEQDRYLRWLETAGVLVPRAWSIRPFSTRELSALMPPDSGHPWAGRPSAESGLELVAPGVFTSYTSNFPWAFNDGPLWQGKGLTMSASGGFSGRWGPLSVTLAPVAFAALNQPFDLQQNGETDSLRFAHGQFPETIDAPQRFGDGTYARLYPGQSTVRLDFPVVTLGVSTANQWWGPAREYPIILGNNAPGFPHAFLGTSAPLDLKIVSLHGRLVWGELSQSPYTRNPPPLDRRFMSGVIGALTIKGVEGLELGGTRFIHQQWPATGLGWRDFARPLGTLQSGDSGSTPTDQLASAYFRWEFPRSGFEVYGEYGREDTSVNLRDLVLEPGHDGGYVLGFAKTWGLTTFGFWGIRGEFLDLQISQLTRVRPQTVFYVHTPNLTQGHTNRGQLLGAAVGTGGAAASVALERYHTGGRWSVEFQRMLREDRGSYWLTGVRDRNDWDVIYALGGDAVVFHGPLELSARLTAMYELNRYLRPDDATNLYASIGATWHPGWRSGARPPAAESPPLTLGMAGAEESPARESLASSWIPGVELRGPDDDRRRLDELLGAAPPSGFLIRSPSSLLGSLPGPRDRLRAAALPPRVDLVANTALPYSLNQGSLWAGAGANARLTAGWRASWGPLDLILAPEVTWSQNRPFEMPNPADRTRPFPLGRDSLSSPWYVWPNSIDEPVRFGNAAFGGLYPGQSTLTFTLGGVAAGLSTENQWWGPGMQNAIVMSDNAPGFPHFFLRTARPMGTPAGDLEGRWLVGALSESHYFDDNPANNLRSLSALVLAWHPKWVPALGLGATRAVYAPVIDWLDLPSHFFDVAWRNPRSNDLDPRVSGQVPGPDQIYSLFARWVFPESGFEVYGEWSRTELPRSFRDFLEAPGHTEGYTLGLQWAKPLGPNALRLQAEHTFVEKGTTFRHRPLATYYTSRTAVQGYTNQGRVLGAAIGPGSSSHWLALDYIAPRWQVGAFGQWVRWEADALYDIPRPLGPCMHDVSVLGGVRGGYAGPIGTVSASVMTGTRMNVFFRNYTVCDVARLTGPVLDVNNTTLEIRYTARLP